MASFRSRVFFLSCGMLLLITIQIYRIHSDAGSIFFNPDEIIGGYSKRNSLHNGENVESTVKSYLEESKSSQDYNSRNEESTKVENAPRLPIGVNRMSQNSDGTRPLKTQYKRKINEIYGEEDAETVLNHSLDLKHSSRDKGNYLERKLNVSKKQSSVERHRIPQDTKREATGNFSWFNTGDLGADYEYYNMSFRDVKQITDNITIDISRYMTGKPVYRAPLKVHYSNLCSLGDAGLYLLVIIPSLPRHHEMRSVIRETWGSAAYNGGFWAGRKVHENMRLVFVFGGTNYTDDDKGILHSELRKHRDILVMDFVDSYQNLSTKMANAFYWAGKYCKNARHLVKVDEDTYVHVPQLIAMIKRVEEMTERFVLGHQHNHLNPTVVRKGRWRVGIEYPLPYYPRYIYGHSYVISGKALPSILHTMARIPGIKNEDAFITGIVAKLNDIPRIHTRAFAGTSYQQVLCNITRGYYVSLTFCCKEHLRMLYKHAVEGKCDQKRFHQIPSWKCRFFKQSHPPPPPQHHHHHHENENSNAKKQKTPVDTKKLERIFNVGAGLIGEMGKKIFMEEEAERKKEIDVVNERDARNIELAEERERIRKYPIEREEAERALLARRRNDILIDESDEFNN